MLIRSILYGPHFPSPDVHSHKWLHKHSTASINSFRSQTTKFCWLLIVFIHCLSVFVQYTLYWHTKEVSNFPLSLTGVDRKNWVCNSLWMVLYKCWAEYNTLRPGQKPTTFFKCIFVNENIWIPIKISLKFVPKSPINNIPALVQIMAWRRPGAKPLSEPMLVRLPTHICATRPQWDKV